MRLDSVAPETARPVVVEVYLLRAGAAGGLAYRRVSGPLGAEEDPDSAARRLGGVDGGGTLVHSTSWRCGEGGQVVLTYAVAPDPRQGQVAVPLEEVSLARGDSPDRPSPVRVEHAQVAAHAARHLAFLLDQDPVAAGPLRADPALAGALTRWSPWPAGRR